MLNKEIIFPIYSKILGKYLKEEMKKKGLSQYDISFAYSKEDIKCIDNRTVRGILKGSRNMTVDSQTGFQESLGIKTPKDLFFPNEQFCLSLISEILEVLKTDSHFKKSSLRRQLFNFLNRRYECNDIKFENFEKNIIDKFIESLLNFFPEFPNEESSLEISEKISDWLVELAFLLSEL